MYLWSFIKLFHNVEGIKGILFQQESHFYLR